MKWIALMVAVMMMTSCGLRTANCVEYRQVIVGVPAKTGSIFNDQATVDVSSTRVEFY